MLLQISEFLFPDLKALFVLAGAGAGSVNSQSSSSGTSGTSGTAGTSGTSGYAFKNLSVDPIAIGFEVWALRQDMSARRRRNLLYISELQMR